MQSNRHQFNLVNRLEETKMSELDLVVQQLLKSDEAQLYEKLGMRVLTADKDPSQANLLNPEVTYDQAEMGAKEELAELGKQIFDRWQIEAFNLVCGAEPGNTEERKQLLEAFGISDAATAAALTALLISYLGVAPIYAPLIAALVVKRFFRPAYDECCQFWKKKLPETAE
jgi:hypothetical protein